MIGSTRSNFYGYMLLLCMLTLMLALAWPASASAQPPGTPDLIGDPGAMPSPPGDPGTDPPGGTGPSIPPVQPPVQPPVHPPPVQWRPVDPPVHERRHERAITNSAITNSC